MRTAPRVVPLLMAAAMLLAMPCVAMAAEEHGGGGESPIAKPAEGLVTAITTLLVFALLLAVLGKWAWGPIAQGLKAREQRIRQEIADAEATRTKADATLKEYQAKLATAEQQVRDLIDSARREAEQIAAEIKGRADKDAQEAMNRAAREIESARQQAIAEIYERAAEISTSIASKILRRNINPDDQRELVQQGLAELEAAGR